MKSIKRNSFEHGQKVFELLIDKVCKWAWSFRFSLYWDVPTSFTVFHFQVYLQLWPSNMNAWLSLHLKIQESSLIKWMFDVIRWWQTLFFPSDLSQAMAQHPWPMKFYEHSNEYLRCKAVWIYSEQLWSIFWQATRVFESPRFPNNYSGRK